MNRSSATDVSVIVPHYDDPDSLDRALTSLAGQTARPLEILVVDDHSPATTSERAAEVCAAHRQRGLPVSFHQLDRNGGPGRARNHAWSLVRGSVIAFCDCDDEWHPRKIEIQAARFADDPDLTLSTHPVNDAPLKTIDNEGSAKRIPKWAWLLMNWANTTTSVMIRADLSHRFPPLTHAEDYDLWLRIAFDRGHTEMLNVVLSRVHKPTFGHAGLSADLRKAFRSERAILRQVCRDKGLGLPIVAGVEAIAWARYIRRLAVTAARKGRVG